MLKSTFEPSGILVLRGKAFAAAYYYGVRKIVTVISLHLIRMLLAKCTRYQHLNCNISHDQYLPDVLMQVNKEIKTKYLISAQGHKHVGSRTWCRAWTHGLVILTPALFHYRPTTQALGEFKKRVKNTSRSNAPTFTTHTKVFMSTP